MQQTTTQQATTQQTTTRQAGPAPTELSFDARRLVRDLLIFCINVEILFFFLDLQINFAAPENVGSVRRLFNTANESSLPSWFSIMQTAMVALTLWAIVVVTRSRTMSAWVRQGWLALALFFSYLALDDGAFLHERLGTAYDSVFKGRAASSSFGAWTLEVFPSYRWQIILMPLLVSMALFMLFFLSRQLKRRRWKVMVILALCCLGLAVGLDFIEGLHENHPWNIYTRIAAEHDWDYRTARLFGETPFDTLRHFSKSLEECIEMFGMTLLWAAFLGQLTWLARDVEIRVRAGGNEAAAA